MRYNKWILVMLTVVSAVEANTQNVGIGTNTPVASALLEINSKTKGILIPKLTKAQKIAIPSPATGLMIFQISPDSVGLTNVVFIIPNTDNTYTLGSSTKRWTTIYTTNNVINTIDAREKKSIASLQYGLKEVMQLKAVSYQWNNNTAGEQIMLGLPTEDVKKIIPEVVLESDNKMGMRSNELIPVLIKAIPEQQKKIEELENKQIR